MPTKTKQGENSSISAWETCLLQKVLFPSPRYFHRSLLVCLFLYLRPVAFCEHGTDTPGRAKHIERLREAIVIDQAGVNRKSAHQEDDVPATENHVEQLVI